MQLWAPPKKDLSRLMTSLIGAIVITYNHRLLLGVILPPTTCLIPPPTASYSFLSSFRNWISRNTLDKVKVMVINGPVVLV